ncbi:hypothetical protein EDI_172540 [Entamoeba dispar SAW760]|uniref:Intermembrane lipid transfer protein VPS13-like C-terminal domain-containing protein n=1 Tax=Entamoeba dispar (strain ATCC PRA-260 / SAW760) TaxID=370354 RepID=B0EIP6_ENTDS|nr:uncharacterized protein EDI_172540 [Entamoeba dispar SAW760]EDR25597.1 hypothetical protein EDI_172540 [Entamoeba dispar SAW760]|eukprot:EDR25597.1 hypothetical protein EDI_172540 [Entamoeba dispar SAW760]
MSTRIRFKMRAGGVNLTVAQSQFKVEEFNGIILTTEKEIKISIGKLKVIDIEKKEQILESEETKESINIKYKYGKNSMCRIEYNSPKLLLVPDVINRIWESLKEVIRYGINIFQEKEKKDIQITQKERLSDLKPPKNRNNVMNQITKEKEINKEKVINERYRLNIVFDLNESQLIFKNNEGNSLLIYATLKGNTVIENGRMTSLNILSNNLSLISKTLMRNEKIQIVNINSFNITTKIGIVPNINLFIDSINTEFSNRDLDITIKLIKEFKENIESISILFNQPIEINKKEISKEGFEFQIHHIIEEDIKSKSILFPKIVFNIIIKNVEMILSSEFISQQGQTVKSCKSLILSTESFLMDFNEKQMEMTINKIQIQYTNISNKKWIIEPLVEPFDIKGKCILPKFQIEISPKKFLIINITPEFIISMNNLFENWAKSINEEYYKNKGNCKIINRVGGKLTIQMKTKTITIEKDSTFEMSLFSERNIQIIIHDFDPITISTLTNEKQYKTIYEVKKNEKTIGCILVKIHFYQRIQIIIISSIVIFKNKTSIPLQLIWNNFETNCFENQTSSFLPMIGINSLKLVIKSAKNHSKYNTLFIIHSLYSKLFKNECTIIRHIDIDDYIDVYFHFRNSIRLGSTCITPLTIVFNSPLTFVNNLPLKLLITCVKNENSFSNDSSTPLSHSSLFQNSKFNSLKELNNKVLPLNNPFVCSTSPSKIIQQSSINQKDILSPSSSLPSQNKNFNLIQSTQQPNPVISTNNTSWISSKEKIQVVVEPFSKGSVTFASLNETIHYFITVLSVADGYVFNSNIMKSSKITYSINQKELPLLIIGSYYFRQRIQENNIIFECPYYIKNDSQITLSIKNYGEVHSIHSYYLYAPVPNKNEKNIFLMDSIIFLEPNNKVSNDFIDLQLGEVKTIHINNHNLYTRVLPHKINNQITSSLRIIIKPHFIFQNLTNEVFNVKNNCLNIKLFPSDKIPIHFTKINIEIVENYGIVLNLTQIDEYQILLKTNNTYKIFNIKTQNHKGSFYTFISGCEQPFLRLDNRTNESFQVKQFGTKLIVRLIPQHSVPFAWTDPDGCRSLIINEDTIDPLNVDTEFVVNKRRVLIDIEDNTTVITVGASKRKKEQVKWSVGVSLPSFGISLFRKNAKEELSLNIKSILLEIIRTDRHLGLEMQFDYIQLDFQSLDILKNPVIISPRPLDWIYDPNKSFFHIGLLLITPTKGNLFQLRYISKATVTIQPLEVLIEPDILQHIYETIKEYPTLFMIKNNTNTPTTKNERRMIIKDFELNSIDVNISINKATTKPPKYSKLVKLVYQIAEMDIDRIPVRINKLIILNKQFSTNTFINQIKDQLMDGLGNLKWIVVGKLFGLRAIIGNSSDSTNQEQTVFRITSMDGIDEITKNECDLFFNRTYLTDSIDSKNFCVTSSKTQDNTSIKDVPRSLVKAQQSTFEYSLKDGTKNLVSSVARGVKGVWKTSVGLTDLAGTQKKQLAPAGFIGGALVGTAGIVVKPLDGIVGFFKSVNDGLTGISFGQIAKERIRPPRYCPEQIICFDYLQSQGWSMLMEADGGAFKELKFYDWIKQFADNKIKGIIFTLESMIGVEKEFGELTKSKWKIPYQLIDSFGFDGNNIVVALKVSSKSKMFQRSIDRFIIKDWSIDYLVRINEIINSIKQRIN